MRPGAYLAAPGRMTRGTPKGVLGDITQSQLDSEAAQRSSALDYAMENLKSARADARRAQDKADARQAEADATARMERIQQQALTAAEDASQRATVIQGGILMTSKSSLNKVLLTVGLGLAASYLLFFKSMKRKKEATT